MPVSEKIAAALAAVVPPPRPLQAIDLSQEPLILLMDDMVRILRIGEGTMRRKIRDGTMDPMPFDKRPYRWLRVEVQASIDRYRRWHVAPTAPLNGTPPQRPRVPTGRPRGRPRATAKRRR